MLCGCSTVYCASFVGASKGAEGPARALQGTPPTPPHPKKKHRRCCPRPLLPQGLSREEAEEIQRGLQPMLKAGQKLSLQESVDPSIIGGVILSMGDKFVDMSILARVKKLQQIVRDAV